MNFNSCLLIHALFIKENNFHNFLNLVITCFNYVIILLIMWLNSITVIM